MKKCLAVLLTAALLLCAAPLAGFAVVDWPEIDFGNLFPTANAATIVDSGACGNDLTWTLDDEGTLTVSGTGSMNGYSYIYDSGYDKYFTIAPWGGSAAKAQRVKTVVIQNSVTSIGD